MDQTNAENRLLQDAINEIKRNRQTIRDQRLRLNMFDDVMKIFNTRPQSEGCSNAPDVVWDLEKQIEKNIKSDILDSTKSEAISPVKKD